MNIQDHVLPRIRFISDTDAMNEADDQYAITHQIISPEVNVIGYVAAHFENKHAEGQRKSMMKSYHELENIIELTGRSGKIPVYKGADHAMTEYGKPIESEGARFIINEAMKDDDTPLFVGFQGTLTDLASAILIEPKIAKRMTAIWIGGGVYPTGEWEFNLSQDIIAANTVFASDLNLWQIPISSYRFVRTSMTELERRVKPHGKIGEYLFRQMLACHMARAMDDTFSEGTPESFIYLFDNYPMESWCLGDQPILSVILDPHNCEYEMIPAPQFTQDMFYIHNTDNRPIRVYNHIDGYLTLEDFFAKLEREFPENR